MGVGVRVRRMRVERVGVRVGRVRVGPLQTACLAFAWDLAYSSDQVCTTVLTPSLSHSLAHKLTLISLI